MAVGFFIFLYIANDTARPSAPIAPLHTHPHGVVLLTGLTFERLQDFDGVDDFYAKLWNNRLTYTSAHGKNHHANIEPPLIRGYELMLVDFKEFDVTRTLHPAWAKIPSILKAFEQHPTAEWVWWLDSDAIIMTPSIELYDYLLSPSALKARLLEGKVLHPNDRVPLEPKGSIRTEKVYTEFRHS